MTGKLLSEPGTLLEAVAGSLRAAGTGFNRQDQAEPAAVLWPDEHRQWEPLIPKLREQVPLLTLGDYDLETLSGPAYWLRCIVDGAITPEAMPQDVPPVIWLPGISRESLRAGEECPVLLRPLVELQYRGTVWGHSNGREWTVHGFLTAKQALQIDVSADQQTRDALQRALVQLAGEPLHRLRQQAPLNAAWFNALLVPDEARSLLDWLNEPSGFKSARDAHAWEAFAQTCDQKFRFHPDHDGPVTAAKLLGQHDAGDWQVVWNRYAEAPGIYPNIPALLRQARPSKDLPLFHDPSSWPQDNEVAEEKLRAQIAMLADVQPVAARAQIAELENQHRMRRGWVWAMLGQAPVAAALEHLVTLARESDKPIAAGSPADLAAWYVETGYRVDRAVLDALATVERQMDVNAVSKAVRAIYLPWLDEVCRRYQDAVKASTFAHRPTLPLANPGICILFADGLRFDVGMTLAERLTAQGLSCQTDWTFAALPTVTATAKPAVSPVAALLAGANDLGTVVAESGRSVNAGVLRSELVKAGFQILTANEVGDPSGMGWTELGAIDSHGHNEEWKIAHRIESEVRLLADRISGLLDAGWREVVVVTDHGWLMLPGGLEKVDLPQHLTVLRKGRCARIQPYMPVDHQTVRWHWDADVPIAYAPGAGCFEAGKEYEHGGLSPQECVVPVLTVTTGSGTAEAVTIGAPHWRGLRCNVTIEGAQPGFTVDLRRKAGDPASSVANQPQPVRDDGKVSVAVIDVDAEGSAILIVVLDESGTPRAQLSTIVGGV